MSSNEAKKAITVPGPAWRLTPGYKPVEIQLAESRHGYGRSYITDKGTRVTASSVWATRDEAIAAGREHLATWQAKLTKMQAALNKRSENLDKADGNAPG